MDDMLAFTTHLPEVRLAPGEVLVHEGTPSGAVWVLVAGALSVRKGGFEVNAIARPGAMVGEVSALLGGPYGATVTATAPTVLRHAVEGAALLARDPAITRLVAIGLAERLNHITAYLVDLKHQYGDAPGLAMVADVLRELAQRQAPPARPGSAREPDPEY